MNESTFVETWGAFGVCLSLLLYAVYWFNDQLRKEREAHQATREARLAEVKDFAARIEAHADKITDKVSAGFDATKPRRRA